MGHQVSTAYERGWASLENGALLVAAEADGFEVFVTTDQNLPYQQNLTQRRISIVVLGTTNWPRIQSHIQLVVDALSAATADALVEGSFP